MRAKATGAALPTTEAERANTKEQYMSYSKLGVDSDGNPIEVGMRDRREGMYIIGATGKGKTVLMHSLIVDDMKQGTGICVLDALGTLVQKIIPCIPQNRLKDVILLNLMDTDHPFGINLYECPDITHPVKFQETVESVMHVWKKIFGIDRETPLLEEYMANLASTIIANPGYTMAEIPLLLHDKWMRDKLLPQVFHNTALTFWRDFEAMTNKDRNDEVRTIMRRLREFTAPMVRNIIGQGRSTINMRQIMDEGKILLITLHPTLDATTSLIGSMIVALVLQAALSRFNIPENRRRQFNFYVDEADRFSTSDFKQVYDMARQFGVATTLAHQTRIYMHTQIPELGRSVLQAATTVVFQVTPPDSDEMVGKFSDEAERPKPEEIGRRKKQTIVLNPVQYLLNNKGGHPNRDINDFVINFLAKLEQICLTKHDNTILLDLSSLLYKAMTTQSVAVVPQDLFVQFFIKYGQELLQSSAFGWLDYTHPVYQGIQITISMQQNYNYLSQCFDDVYMQPQNGAQTSTTLFGQMNTVLIEAYTAWYNRFSSLRFPLNPRNIADTYTPAIHQQVMKILLDLRKVIDILVNQPLKADGMEDEIITRPGQQKTRSERQAEIKDELSKLPVLIARVRLKEYPPNLKTSVCHCCGKVNTLAAYPVFCDTCGVHTQPEYKITVQPVPITMSPHAITARLTAITQQNLADGYLREKKAVEDEIKRRQEVPVVQNTANVNQPLSPPKKKVF